MISAHYKSIAPLFLKVLFVTLIVRYQIILTDYRLWEDESATILVAKMMNNGQLLYSEIFSMHGPASFYPSMLIQNLGFNGIYSHRLIVAFLQLCSIFSVYYSPIVAKENKTIYFACYILGICSIIFFALPKFLSHAYYYQSLVGPLILIVFSQYTLPALYGSVKIRPYIVALSNFIIGSLPFFAVTLSPLSIILFVISAKTKYLSRAFLFFFIGIFLNFFLLYKLSSLIGYLIFHFYMNAKILPFFAPQWWPKDFFGVLNNITFSLTHDLSGFFTLIFSLILLCNSFFYEKVFKWKLLVNWKSLLFIISLTSLLIRGPDNKAMPYYYAALSLPLLIINKSFFIRKPNYYLSLFFIVFFLYFILKISLLLDSDRKKIDRRKIPVQTEFSSLVKAITNSDDKIIAYSNQVSEYLFSDRLPASAYYSYFPTFEKYNQLSILNFKINACSDIYISQPKVIYIDRLNLWDTNPWGSYGKCVQDIADRYYVEINDKSYYVRNDVYFMNQKLINKILNK